MAPPVGGAGPSPPPPDDLSSDIFKPFASLFPPSAFSGTDQGSVQTDIADDHTAAREKEANDQGRIQSYRRHNQRRLRLPAFQKQLKESKLSSPAIESTTKYNT